SATEEDAARARSQLLRRRLFQSALAAALVFLAASLATGWQYVRAESARRIAAEQETIAKAERDQAQRSLATAQLNESRFLTTLAVSELRNGNLERAGLIARAALPTDMRTSSRPLWGPAVGVVMHVLSLDHLKAVLEGHTDSLWSAAWSPDGTRIVTASSDKSVRVWDTKTGVQLAVLPTRAAAVVSASWSPDGTRILIATSNTVQILDAKAGSPIVTLKGHQDAIWSAAWSPEGARIATASSDMSARIWSAATGAEITKLLGHTDAVRSVAWSPDGMRVVTASTDSTARIWDLASGSPA